MPVVRWSGHVPMRGLARRPATRKSDRGSMSPHSRPTKGKRSPEVFYRGEPLAGAETCRPTIMT